MTRYLSAPLAATVLTTAILMPGVALAGNVFLLQLGSFPTQAEADQRFSELQSKYPDALEGLSKRIDPVGMREGKTLFRTQAGPLDSREEAQKRCITLAKAQQGCMIVESAMARRLASPVAHVPLAPQPLAPQMPAADAQMSPPALPVAPASVVIPPQAMSGADQLLDNAAMAIPAPQTPVPAEPQKRGFFSRMFGGDEPQQAADVIEPAPMPMQETPASTPAPASGLAMDSGDFSPPAFVPPPSASAPSSSLPPPPMMSRSDAAFASVAAVTAAPILSREMAPAQAVTQPQPVVVNPPQELPFKVGDSLNPKPSQGLVARLFGNASPPPVAMVPAPADAQVNVAEAVRVPLSNESVPNLPPQPPAMVAGAPSAPMLDSVSNFVTTPSEPSLNKTQWAQVSTFVDQQTALVEWENFRRMHPELPPMRVRVTRPFTQSSAGYARVSLRVGPFEKVSQMNEFCAAMVSEEEADRRCTAVEEIGDSTSAGMERVQTRGNFRSRYGVLRSLVAEVASNWVQLGTYASATKAQEAWDGLKVAHSGTLANMLPNITLPSASSSKQAMYRLRTGPFVNVIPAVEMCNKLRAGGTNCMVVDGQ